MGCLPKVSPLYITILSHCQQIYDIYLQKSFPERSHPVHKLIKEGLHPAELRFAFWFEGKYLLIPPFNELDFINWFRLWYRVSYICSAAYMRSDLAWLPLSIGFSEPLRCWTLDVMISTSLFLLIVWNTWKLDKARANLYISILYFPSVFEKFCQIIRSITAKEKLTEHVLVES